MLPRFGSEMNLVTDHHHHIPPTSDAEGITTGGHVHALTVSTFAPGHIFFIPKDH
jgi:hypothetical protein